MSVWDDLQGQAPVVTALRRAAAEGAPTHAWLFTGPPGSGRSNAARAFAAALQCERPDPADRGCGQCHACHTVLAGTHADVTRMATDKVTIAIAEVRALISRAQDKPSSGRWRIIIIEDADRMVERTTNVLLKAIEEPPPRTLWMLCAPSPADVIVTIRSRCRPVGLRIPPVDDVAALLTRRDGVEPATALTVARMAQSHIGVARRLARDPEARARRDEIVTLPLRLSDVSGAVRAAGTLVDLAQADAEAATVARNATEKAELLTALGLTEQDKVPPAVRSQLKHLADEQKRRATRSQRDALDRAMTDLSTFYRDVLVLQLGARSDLVNGHLDITLREFAAASSPETTLRRIDAIAEARERLAANVAPLLALEAMTVSLLS
ncbi:DNA polymerase III subunit delta [Tersicoccus solisilvae]|uniref:DNA polymerase III subunit delta n=1 Tax=Tersicoccus solisilvae TaxID=1882339 RepID=A0ABQ1PNP6_9MICC|nr:DNA polymerase III subunit delta' [Tersicoccus solisilvae]GGD00368.1 DNA polymerase III subunit delta [Tersicoccus solisilvae]